MHKEVIAKRETILNQAFTVKIAYIVLNLYWYLNT